MAQTTEWLPAILDYKKKVKSSTSTAHSLPPPSLEKARVCPLRQLDGNEEDPRCWVEKGELTKAEVSNEGWAYTPNSHVASGWLGGTCIKII